MLDWRLDRIRVGVQGWDTRDPALIDAILRHEALEAYVANADDPVWEDAKNPPRLEWNCRLGLIVDDNAMWRLPLRERIVSSIGRLVMRLARRNGRVGWNPTSR